MVLRMGKTLEARTMPGRQRQSGEAVRPAFLTGPPYGPTCGAQGSPLTLKVPLWPCRPKVAREWLVGGSLDSK